MRTFTTLRRWLLMMFIVAGVTGTAYGQRTVTLRLNTATLPDTLDAADEIQVRGAVEGTGNFTLPDGNVIDWNDNTTLKPANDGGDYWNLSFKIPDGQKLDYKFYSQLLEDDGGGGWEDGDNVVIAAGTGDVDTGLHYFNKVGNRDYNWSPFEQKQDSIGVMFRVFMNTTAGGTSGSNGYLGTSADQVGVRGDDMGGATPIDWGTTKVALARESDDDTKPGSHIWSGIGYYPASLAGSTQAYKYFVEPDGWEEGNLTGNRTFTIPAQDSTLHWVYYGDTPPLTGQEKVEADVTFSVDLDPLERIGLFRRARGDTLQVRGGFNGWGCNDPSKCLLFKQFGLPLFDAVITVNEFPGTTFDYKYFIDFNIPEMMDDWNVDVIPSGWEEPIGTQGGNRQVEYTGEDLTLPQVFNDIFPANIIPAGNQIDVTFSVDMTAALTADDPFDPAVDSVGVQFEDPFWEITQGMPLVPRSTNPADGDNFFLGDAVDMTEFIKTFSLTDPDEDMVYTGTLSVYGPTYNGFQYRYIYGQPNTTRATVSEVGGSTATGGRRRTRFILPNPDGSWPAEFAVAAESVHLEEGPLPFDSNPAVVTNVEEVSAEVPTTVTLSQNFPNPFNPTTSFEYEIDKTADVKIKIYDILGRVVLTLVDGVQPAATYRMTFDASRLASGTYIYRLEAAGKTVTRTMVLLK